MKLDVFEHTVTYKLNFMRAIAEERSVPFENMLKIDGYEDIGLSYMLSSIRNNSVVQNFFSYSRGSLKGLYVRLQNLFIRVLFIYTIELGFV